MNERCVALLWQVGFKPAMDGGEPGELILSQYALAAFQPALDLTLQDVCDRINWPHIHLTAKDLAAYDWGADRLVHQRRATGECVVWLEDLQ